MLSFFLISLATLLTSYWLAHTGSTVTFFRAATQSFAWVLVPGPETSKLITDNGIQPLNSLIVNQDNFQEDIQKFRKRKSCPLSRPAIQCISLSRLSFFYHLIIFQPNLAPAANAALPEGVAGQNASVKCSRVHCKTHAPISGNKLVSAPTATGAAIRSQRMGER